MFKYSEYYGYWESDTDSEGGGDDRYRPNLGEGGRDTGFSPALPPPPPPTPPPSTSTMKATTPIIMTLNELDEYAFDGGGYKPSGQFTEARAYPLSIINANNGTTTKAYVALNERTNYNYSPLLEANGGDEFRFPYFVPLGANLATLPMPSISYTISTQNNASGYNKVESRVRAWCADSATKSNLVVLVNAPATINAGSTTFTFATNQMLSFTPGKFNDFKFRLSIEKTKGTSNINESNMTTSAPVKTQVMITNITTSLPPGYEFEFKLQKNWESYFNIRVVNKNDRNLKGTSTSVTTVSNTPQPIPGYTLSAPWSWNEYNVAAGYTHWEIPVSVFAGNKLFDWPIIVMPENDDYCSMERGYKLPGPKAPWNLISRHETFWYAATQMRSTDYAQNITNAIFYCPRNWRGVVWLKQGTAINDIL